MSKVGEVTAVINIDGAELAKQILKNTAPIKTEYEKAKELYKKIVELYPGAESVDIYCEHGEIKVKPQYSSFIEAD